MVDVKNTRVNKANAHCCVPQCTTYGYVVENGQKVSFHRIPKDPNLSNTWLELIRHNERPDIIASSHKRVCSRHFQESDFFTTQNGRRFLRPKTTDRLIGSHIIITMIEA